MTAVSGRAQIANVQVPDAPIVTETRSKAYHARDEVSMVIQRWRVGLDKTTDESVKCENAMQMKWKGRML